MKAGNQYVAVKAEDYAPGGVAVKDEDLVAEM